MQKLIKLSTSNSVTLAWVPEHREETGNEKTNVLVKKGEDEPNIRPKHMIGIPKK